MHVGIDVAEVFEIVMYLSILTFQATYFTLDIGNINIWLVIFGTFMVSKSCNIVVLSILVCKAKTQHGSEHEGVKGKGKAKEVDLFDM